MLVLLLSNVHHPPLSSPRANMVFLFRRRSNRTSSQPSKPDALGYIPLLSSSPLPDSQPPRSHYHHPDLSSPRHRSVATSTSPERASPQAIPITARPPSPRCPSSMSRPPSPRHPFLTGRPPSPRYPYSTSRPPSPRHSSSTSRPPFPRNPSSTNRPPSSRHPSSANSVSSTSRSAYASRSISASHGHASSASRYASANHSASASRASSVSRSYCASPISFATPTPSEASMAAPSIPSFVIWYGEFEGPHLYWYVSFLPPFIIVPKLIAMISDPVELPPIGCTFYDNWLDALNAYNTHIIKRELLYMTLTGAGASASRRSGASPSSRNARRRGNSAASGASHPSVADGATDHNSPQNPSFQCVAGGMTISLCINTVSNIHIVVLSIPY